MRKRKTRYVRAVRLGAELADLEQIHEDSRQPITLDLRAAGGGVETLEPRLGYVAWRRRSEYGEVKDCAALKTLLHRIADELPRQLGARNFM
jgi:hypothetical protein